MWVEATFYVLNPYSIESMNKSATSADFFTTLNWPLVYGIKRPKVRNLLLSQPVPSLFSVRHFFLLNAALLLSPAGYHISAWLLSLNRLRPPNDFLWFLQKYSESLHPCTRVRYCSFIEACFAIWRISTLHKNGECLTTLCFKRWTFASDKY
jgi:hypothetical protein